MNFFSIRFESCYQLILNFNWLLISVILFVIFIINYFFKNNLFSNKYEIDKAEIGLGQGKVVIKPNNYDYQIAYQIWVEVSTRKIGLSIDFENDVIEEIYNSWYEFFKITRELIKEIPVSRYQKSKSTQELVKIALEILNISMRPHLTAWQAKYRKWLDEQENNHPNKHPQDIQKCFPQYRELISDMRKVNKQLMSYRSMLEEIVLSR